MQKVNSAVPNYQDIEEEAEADEQMLNEFIDAFNDEIAKINQFYLKKCMELRDEFKEMSKQYIAK